MPTWDADLYLRFADERTRPASDLLARVGVDRPRRVIDLGCGPGNSTALLRQRWPGAAIIGLDTSPDMIAAAKKAYPEGTWIAGDIRTFADPMPFDVIFSNAALQWVPRHGEVLPRLLGQVTPGGTLAVQVPRHIQSPLHQLMLRIADDPAWRDRMDAPRRTITVETPSFYYDLLQPLADRIDLWETEYHHVLENPAAILAWIRGTGLRPFLEALAGDEERGRFEERLLGGLEQAYPRQGDGRVLFTFRRLFLVAYRAGTVKVA